jgi:hypothetical protein
MSKCPMRGHFRYLRFKTFPMTPRTPQWEVFWVLLSSSEHLGVPEDSNSRLFQVLGFTPTLGQSRGATFTFPTCSWHFQVLGFTPTLGQSRGATFTFPTCSWAFELLRAKLLSVCCWTNKISSVIHKLVQSKCCHTINYVSKLNSSLTW